MTTHQQMLRASASAAPAFFDTITMLREFWAEDPSWTNPGDGNDLTTVRDNGTLAADLSAVRELGTDNYPSFVVSGINGLPSFYFNNPSGNSGGALRSTAGSNGGGGSDATWIAVVESDNVSRDGTIFTAQTAYQPEVRQTGSKYFMRADTVSPSMSGGAVDTSPHLIVACNVTDDAAIIVDGVTVVDETTAWGSDNATGYVMGASRTISTDFYIGRIAYAAVYAGDLRTNPDYDDYVAAIQDYYGLSSATPFLGAPFQWEHAYDAAGPEMSGTYSDGDPVTGAWLDEVQSFNPARTGGGTITYRSSAPSGGGFFDTMGMRNEVWAEDPSWTNPGDGNDMVTWRNNGSNAVDFVADRDNPTDDYPVWLANGLNGKPAVYFNNPSSATGGFLLINSAASMADPFTVVAVGKHDSVSATRYLVGGNSTRGTFYNNSGTGQWSASGGTPTIAGGTADTDIHLHVAKWEDGASEYWVDGASIGTDIGTVGAPGTLYIGSASTAIDFLDGSVAYVAWYNGDLTAHADYDEYIHNLMSYYGVVEGVGGRPSLDFDGTGYFTGDVGVAIVPSHSVVTVLESDVTSTSTFVDSGASAGTGHTQLINGSASWELEAGASLVDGAADTNPHLLVSVVQLVATGNDLIRIDGVTVTAGSAGNDNVRPVTLGAAYGGGSPFNGRVAAVGIYAGDVTTEPGFADWETDVLNHYGITAPTDGGFFGTIGMLREFWAEDPSWTNPGDGADMTTWRDNGSLANDLSAYRETGSDNYPTYEETGGIGRPAVRINNPVSSSGGGMRSTDSDTNPADLTIVVIGSYDSSGGPRYMTGAPGSGSSSRNLIGSTGVSQWIAYQHASIDIRGGSSIADTNAHLFVFHASTTASDFLVDGVSIGTAGAATSSTSTGWALGYRGNDDSDFWSGRIAYAAVYDGDLTAHADYDEYIHNLRTYYGI